MSLLRDLNALGERLAIDPDVDFLPVGYETKPVAFVVDIDTRLGTMRIADLRSPENRNRGGDRAVPFQKRSGSAAPPNLVCDNLQYVGAVGKDAEPKAAAKAAELQRAWLELMSTASTEVGGKAADALDAITNAMSDPSVLLALMQDRGIPLPEKPGEAAALLCTFMVDGIEPLDFPELQGWWANLVSSDAAGEPGLCQVTNTVAPLARKFDAIRLPGNQPTLISANFEAAERYSSSQSTGARISVAAAKRSHAALNWLLANDAHNARLGDARLVWWVPGAPDDDIFASLINDPNATDVEALTRGLQTS